MLAPSRSSSAINSRQRPEDTPSHGGGLTSNARKRLEEHRARRSNPQPLAKDALANSRDVRAKGNVEGDALGDFRDRLNRKQAYAYQAKQRDDPDRRVEGADRRPAGEASVRRTASSSARYDETPSSTARMLNKSWDATPSASERGGSGRSNGDGRSRRAAWDATPSRPDRRRGDNDYTRTSEWDTPRRPNHYSGTDYPEELPSMTPSIRGIGGADWEEEQLRLDRDWYTQEDGAGESAFADYDEDTAALEKEADLSQRQVKRTNVRQAQYNADNELWETNRLAQSGLGGRRVLDLDFDDEEESKVHLLVHDLRPPFLDGRIAFTKQIEPVNPIRDPTSDLAVFSKKGSALVKERREQRERAKAARKVAEIAGTTLGNLTGAKEEVEQDVVEAVNATLEGGGKSNGKKNADGEDTHSARKESQFAQHLKGDSKTGASSFSRSKTLKEQRQYLPAFACREQLMKAIRENQVTIVIGETGSGKTTQLTQFLHEEGYTKHGMVGCTQPRRVAAMSVAKRVSEEMESELGKEVGYAIRFEDCTGPDTVIKCKHAYGISKKR